MLGEQQHEDDEEGEGGEVEGGHSGEQGGDL